MGGGVGGGAAVIPAFFHSKHNNSSIVQGLVYPLFRNSTSHGAGDPGSIPGRRIFLFFAILIPAALLLRKQVML